MYSSFRQFVQLRVSLYMKFNTKRWWNDTDGTKQIHSTKQTKALWQYKNLQRYCITGDLSEGSRA
jgi:hypothetical protein